MKYLFYQRMIISFCIIVFLMGLHVYVNGYIRLDQLNLEGMQNRSRRKPECGNVLVKRGEHIYLYNTNDNSDSLPIHFNNLDEYIEYVQNQRSQNIQCPILFLQEESDVQGNTFYKAKPSPHDLTNRDLNHVQPIIDSSRTSKTFNKNQYHGFDPYGQDIGVYNEMDVLHDSTAKSTLSDNPMDPNWGGVEHTEKQVESGKYDKRMVTKPTYFTPKTEFLKDLGGRTPPPSYISSKGTFY